MLDRSIVATVVTVVFAPTKVSETLCLVGLSLWYADIDWLLGERVERILCFVCRVWKIPSDV